MGRFWAKAIWATALLAASAGLLVGRGRSADEAVLTDGRRLSGTMRFPADGRLHFGSGPRDLRLDELQQICLTSADLPPLRAAAAHCVLLRDGQQLTGELLGLDGDKLRLATIWTAKPMGVPRSRIAAITHLPGFVTVFHDDFEAEPKAWQLTGKVTLSDKEKTSGKQSLLLDAPGQIAALSPASRERKRPEGSRERPEAKREQSDVEPKPELSAGRIGINFFDPGPTPAARWLVEAEFAAAKGPQLVQATVVGPGERYQVRIGDRDALTPERLRTRGWHRLTIAFAPDKLDILVDDRVLWETDKLGPGGALNTLRLKCIAEKTENGEAGRVWFDDCSIAQAVSALRRPDGDLTQDEVWLLSGDQLFGKLSRADRSAIELDGRLGKRTIAWTEVRGLYLRSEPAPPTSTDGEHVRALVWPGTGSHLDRLDGAVRALDERSLTLVSPALGDIAVERGRLRQIQPLLHGRRIEVDTGLHHLGKSVRPDFLVPQPEGLSLRKTFALAAIPESARLAIAVAHLKGPGDGRKMAQALERGGLRTEVVLNGKTVDYLNRHVESSAAEFRSVRIGLPRDALKVGDNQLELRQTIDRDTGQYEDCLVGPLVVEVPR
jgi:hypothetical protein